MKPEVHVFVIWPFAMKARDRILSDIAEHAEILASVEAGWPEGVSAEAGYRRFYGALLPDAVGKAKRAGTGRFQIVVVRIAAPCYDLRMTQRGFERVNLDMFEMKWRYREWVGGLHRVHGTNSVAEARRDIMLLTGHALAEWEAGTVPAEDVCVLPGQSGWSDLAEVFAFLNEVHPYVVMRNAEGLPTRFDPTHDDLDLMVGSAKECAGLLCAQKRSGGQAAHAIKVAGRAVKVDFREVEDRYYDETWARRMLARRVLNAAGVYEPESEDAFYALLAHVVYMKPRIAHDYRLKLPQMAAALGIKGGTVTDWCRALERFMAAHGYRFAQPKDPSVHLNALRLEWRKYAAEASELFGLTKVEPVLDSVRPLEFTAERDGLPVRVVYSPERFLVSREYELADALHGKASGSVARPLTWHVGVRGAYLVTERPTGTLLSVRLAHGPLTAAEADRLADGVRQLVAALDKAGVVHRAIDPESLLVAEDGAVTLDGLGQGVRRKDYKCEAPYFRRSIAKRLVPLGGTGVTRPGEWNDRQALAGVLRAVTGTDKVAETVDSLEKESVAGIGTLKVSVRKLRLRLLRLGLEVLVRGWLSPRRRRSPEFVRLRKFILRALT